MRCTLLLRSKNHVVCCANYLESFGGRVNQTLSMDCNWKRQITMSST